MRNYSIIIPVYNRPQELKELLLTLTKQIFKNFEVLVIDDGSEHPCKEIVESFKSSLNVSYYFKPNSGQGFTRNYGYNRATGDYFIVFDSDCLIPSDYLLKVDNYLSNNFLDAYGGPDRAHPSFNALQKAINYSMTSFFTTGGIRGRKKHAGTFHPRSFNMGISRKVFEVTGGYIIPRMGEDIEFSIRIINSGFKTGLIEEAYVYHKRRTNLNQFFKQLHFFGRARINIFRFFPDELKWVHLLPALFTLGFLFYLISWIINKELFLVGSILIFLYFLMILIDATVKNSSLKIGFLSVITSFVQLTGYGLGFISEVFSKNKRPVKKIH
jgi:glycosyltransferase involved in cell wall biosynthesis